jgi:hypothetical protein|tara:strand:+ start:1744 stop:3606 length:1863 start_codon:yes stop_codon:yes gene_type:complete
MADKNIYTRLRRLFSSNVIVRNVGGRKLKVTDTSRIQTNPKASLVDRYTKLYTSYAGTSGYNYSLYQKTQRLGLFRDYEAMDVDPIIASALDIYADESTMKSEYGDVLNITSDNNDLKDILHNLFYDILNIEFNLWPWVRNMVKYGDFFLKLEINEKYGITNVIPMSAYDITRVEGDDPENPEYVKFILESTDQRHQNNAAKEEFENYEVAHFRMLSDSNYLPYGKSMIEQARQIWKQVTLMEDAMLIHRIMRAPEKRIFKIDIGNIPPAEVDNYMQRIINKMKKAPVIDEATGEYNLKYNMQNLTEDFYLPVRGGDSGTQLENLPGLEFNAIDDIEYLKNKLLAALRVPKAYLGYEEEVGSKATLAAEDVRFARTIERIQRIVVSELTKIAIVHLYAQGYQDKDLVNFELGLTNPSTIYEQEKLELWNTKLGLAETAKRDNLVSSLWIYKNVFGFTDAEISKMNDEMIFDKFNAFRQSQIENEGNDPAKSGQSQGTPADLAMGRTGRELEFDARDLDKDLKPEEVGGRPEEGPKYGKDGSARGRDPLGKRDYEKNSTGKYQRGRDGEFRGGSPLALAHFDAMEKNMKKYKGKSISVLNEELNDTQSEYDKDIDEMKIDK